MTPINEWDIEPNMKKWIDKDTGLTCFAVRVKWSGHLCGYVKIPVGNRYYRKPYYSQNYNRYSRHRRRNPEKELRVHGGITFGGQPARYTGGRLRGSWLGFDCAHYSDMVPGMEKFTSDGVYRNLAYVEEQCKKLARQIISKGKK
jgi:hypothetical protein